MDGSPYSRHYQAGRAAKEQLLFNSGWWYSGKTLAQAITRYAPHFENDTNGYIGTVARDTGVDPNTPLSALSPQQRVRMLDAMERVEGFSAGRPSAGGRYPAMASARSISQTSCPHFGPTTARQDGGRAHVCITHRMRQNDGHNVRISWRPNVGLLRTRGLTTTKLPLEIQQQLGIDGMNTLWSYNDRIAQAGAVQTDEQLYAELQRLQAEDPHQFAEDVDLFDYIDRLSNLKGRRELQQLQVDAIKDRREGTEKALTEAKIFRPLCLLQATGWKPPVFARQVRQRTTKAGHVKPSSSVRLSTACGNFRRKKNASRMTTKSATWSISSLLPIIAKNPACCGGRTTKKRLSSKRRPV